jgi:hypothetical protein
MKIFDICVLSSNERDGIVTSNWKLDLGTELHSKSHQLPFGTAKGSYKSQSGSEAVAG